MHLGTYDLYTWGDNSSYTLGHGRETRCQYPDVVETLRKKRVSIKKVRR